MKSKHFSQVTCSSSKTSNDLWSCIKTFFSLLKYFIWHVSMSTINSLEKKTFQFQLKPKNPWKSSISSSEIIYTNVSKVKSNIKSKYLLLFKSTRFCSEVETKRNEWNALTCSNTEFQPYLVKYWMAFSWMWQRAKEEKKKKRINERMLKLNDWIFLFLSVLEASVLCALEVSTNLVNHN